jgi:hypothetical protein
MQENEGNGNEVPRYLLPKQSWENILSSDDVNTSFNSFMITFMYYFNRAFPLITTYVKDKFENKSITKGLIVSSNRM